MNLPNYYARIIAAITVWAYVFSYIVTPAQAGGQRYLAPESALGSYLAALEWQFVELHRLAEQSEGPVKTGIIAAIRERYTDASFIFKRGGMTWEAWRRLHRAAWDARPSAFPFIKHASSDPPIPFTAPVDMSDEPERAKAADGVEVVSEGDGISNTRRRRLQIESSTAIEMLRKDGPDREKGMRILRGMIVPGDEAAQAVTLKDLGRRNPASLQVLDDLLERYQKDNLSKAERWAILKTLQNYNLSLVAEKIRLIKSGARKNLRWNLLRKNSLSRYQSAKDSMGFVVSSSFATVFNLMFYFSGESSWHVGWHIGLGMVTGIGALVLIVGMIMDLFRKGEREPKKAYDKWKESEEKYHRIVHLESQIMFFSRTETGQALLPNWLPRMLEATVNHFSMGDRVTAKQVEGWFKTSSSPSSLNMRIKAEVPLHRRARPKMTSFLNAVRDIARRVWTADSKAAHLLIHNLKENGQTRLRARDLLRIMLEIHSHDPSERHFPVILGLLQRMRRLIEEDINDLNWPPAAINILDELIAQGESKEFPKAVALRPHESIRTALDEGDEHRVLPGNATQESVEVPLRRRDPTGDGGDQGDGVQENIHILEELEREGDGMNLGTPLTRTESAPIVTDVPMVTGGGIKMYPDAIPARFEGNIRFRPRPTSPTHYERLIAERARVLGETLDLVVHGPEALEDVWAVAKMLVFKYPELDFKSPKSGMRFTFLLPHTATKEEISRFEVYGLVLLESEIRGPISIDAVEDAVIDKFAVRFAVNSLIVDPVTWQRYPDKDRPLMRSTLTITLLNTTQAFDDVVGSDAVDTHISHMLLALVETVRAA